MRLFFVQAERREVSAAFLQAGVGPGSGKINFDGEVVSVARLTEKQKRFVEEYLVDLNATQAAIRAGYSPKTAEQVAYQLLQKTSVSTEIQLAIKKRSERTEITQDRVLRELAAIGFARATDYAGVKDGAVQVYDTDRLTDVQSRAIAGIKEGKYGVEVTLCDKIKALSKLGEHLGLFSCPAGGTPAPEESSLLDALVQATEEDMDTDDLPEVE